MRGIEAQATRFEFVLTQLEDYERAQIEALVARDREVALYLEEVLEQVPVTNGTGVMKLLVRRFGLLGRSDTTLPSVVLPSGEKIDPPGSRAEDTLIHSSTST